MVKGLTEAAAARIVAARAQRPFASIDDLARRAALDRRDLHCLADADAFAALAGHRREAAWDVAGIERTPALLQAAPFHETAPHLAEPTEGASIVADYRSLGLTLGRHPLALLRPRLAAMRLATAAAIRAMPHGRIARAAGLVIGRQRPDTASGVIFVTLEDETGCVNVVVWHALAERQRRELLGSRLLEVRGTVERDATATGHGVVVHLVAGWLADHSALLGQLAARSRDFH
jgi:error-prone DNA polymerase